MINYSLSFIEDLREELGTKNNMLGNSTRYKGQNKDL